MRLGRRLNVTMLGVVTLSNRGRLVAVLIVLFVVNAAFVLIASSIGPLTDDDLKWVPLAFMLTIPWMFVGDILSRAWIVDTPSRIVIARRGLVGRIIVHPRRAIVSVKVIDEPLTLQLDVRDQGCLSVGPFDPDFVFPSARNRKACARFVDRWVALGQGRPVQKAARK